ncbi:hypothetical protein [Halorarius litoreus]|uniref:hypothetical protein n=1 Tax=Halorarius litoreus TaxID=2962676 RepID=UPI0020CF227D|nr:hypothetical protein [Halorarius litoreus]
MASDDRYSKALTVRAATRFLDHLVAQDAVEPIETEAITDIYDQVLADWRAEFDDPDYTVEIGGPQLALSALSETNQYLSFDTEGPSPWDEGYRKRIPELVALTDGLLDGVSFTVEPTAYPRTDDGPRLVAKTDDWECTARMRDFGDYCDVGGLMDFMNAVVGRYDTDKRFVTPQIPRDQTVWIFFAQPDRTRELESAFETAFENERPS